MKLTDIEKQLKRMKHNLLEDYLKHKRPIEMLPRLIAQLKEDEREKFFKLLPNGINASNLEHAVGLCERTIKSRKDKNVHKD